MRRRFRRTAIIISVMALALTSPGHAACGPGPESCDPSADEVRAKIERLLDSAWLTPHAIVSLERFDGHSIEAEGHKKYELRIFVVSNYFGDGLHCRANLCPELSNYLVKVDAAEKKVTVAGWLFFEQAGQGWR